MKQDYREELNRFFVTTFNKILAWEEKSLEKSGLKDISVKEIHIIEAAAHLEPIKANTMTHIADRINISVGALTTAVNAVVRKGYLFRGSDEKDRRIVYLHLTDAGKAALKIHDEFHNNMVDSIINILDEQSLDTTTKSLELLTNFFENLLSN